MRRSLVLHCERYVFSPRPQFAHLPRVLKTPLNSYHSCQGVPLRFKVSRKPRIRLYTPSSPYLLDQPFSHREASFTGLTLIIACALGGAILVEYFARDHSQPNVDRELVPNPVEVEPTPELEDDRYPAFDKMATPPGTLGNLTADQEARLRELWVAVFKAFGVKDPSGETETQASHVAAQTETPTASDTEGGKKKHSLFHRKNKESISSNSPGNSPGRNSANDPEDKYGQTRELQEILASTSPESLRTSFWLMVKKDHPDALLLRFLRARKWDVQKALAMMISTLHWRSSQMHVDDDIVKHGEGGALEDSKSSDGHTKKEGADFLAQLRLGKSFIHGTDKEGRPICFVRVRLHRSGEQTERALERYTVYVIETCRLVLQPPVETAVSLANGLLFGAG